jgi:hypothetical protein
MEPFEGRTGADVPPAFEDEDGFAFRLRPDPPLYRPSLRVLVLAWLCDLMRRLEKRIDSAHHSSRR